MSFGTFTFGSGPQGAQSTPLIIPLALPAVLPKFMLNNWVGRVLVETSYLTDVTVSNSLAEDRVSLRSRPIRSIRNRFTGTTREDSKGLLLSLARKGNNRLIYPFYSDLSKLSSAYTAPGTVLDCVTEYRRFFVGGRIVVYENEVFELSTIQDITTSSLTITALTSSFSTQAIVFPLLDTEIDLASTLRNITDYHADIDFNAFEVSGASALPQTTGAPPATYNGLPILTTPVNWADSMETGMIRAGRRINFERSTSVETRGSRPQHQLNGKFTALSRAELWDILNLFDSRKGRARAFWALSYMTLWKITAISSNTVTVEKGVQIEDIADFLTHIGIIDTSNNYTLAAIQGVAEVGNTFVLTTVETLPALTVDQVRVLTSGHLVRSTSDSLVENWISDEYCEVSLQMIELLDESDIILTGVS